MFRLVLKLAINSAFLRLSRTLLVVIMIAVSMSMMLSIQGIYDGMVVNMVDKTKRSDYGEISIYHKEYRLNKVLANSMTHADKMLTDLKQHKDVDAVVHRIQLEGLSSTAKKSSLSLIIGIDLQAEEKFGKFSEFLTEGEISFRKKGAIIGSELAKTLKIRIGSKVVFSTQDQSGEINSMAVRIRGIINSTNMALDAKGLFVDRKRMDRFLGITSDVATQIAIRTQSETLLSELTKRYPTLEVKGLLELQPILKMLQDMMVIFNGVTFFIVMLVVFIGILGVMYVSILDRIREFGIMRGIGMPYSTIRLQIFLEAFFVGIIGYALGAVLGLLSLLYLKEYGLDMSAYADGLQSFGYSTILYADIKLLYFTSTFYAIIGASLLSVLLPLRKIKKLNPIDVIKADS